MKTLFEKLKTLHIDTVIYGVFQIYWEETTVRISENEVIEIGGFLLSLFIFFGCLFLLNYMGFVNVF